MRSERVRDPNGGEQGKVSINSKGLEGGMRRKGNSPGCECSF